MSLLGSTSGIPEPCVPAAARPLWKDGVLYLDTEGPPALHLFVDIPVAAVTLTLAVYGLVLTLTGEVGVVAGGFGTSVLLLLGGKMAQSIAYSIRGRAEIRWEDRAWHITRRLWRWSSTNTVKASQIRHVELWQPFPGDLFFPGEEGRYLIIHMYQTDKTICVAHGLHLPSDVLAGVRELLATRDE